MSRYDDLLRLKEECEARREAEERSCVAFLTDLAERLRDFLGWPPELWERVPLDAEADGEKQLPSGMVLQADGWVVASVAARGPVGMVMDLRAKIEGSVTQVAVGDLEAALRDGEPGDVELLFRRVFERLRANVRASYGPPG